MWQPGIFYDTKREKGGKGKVLSLSRPQATEGENPAIATPFPRHNKTEKTMIHQYKLSGYNIVLDVYSGSVHAVDDVAYDAIALIDQGSSREQAAAALAKKSAPM